MDCEIVHMRHPKGVSQMEVSVNSNGIFCCGFVIFIRLKRWK